MILLRSLLFNVYFYAVTVGFCVAGIAVRFVAPGRVPAFARAWVRVLLAGARGICGIRLVLTGTEHLPPGPALLASQHQSAYDTLIWMVLLPHTTYVVKQELIGIPLFGPLLVGAGMIGVDRNAGAPALKRMLREAEAAVGRGRQIVIFPEGTRVAPGVQVPLRPGIAALASRLGLPVIPVATDSGRYWGRRAFRREPGDIHVTICKPLATGLPRAAVLDQIVTSWRLAEQGFEGPVDKSVDRCGRQGAFL